VAEQGLTVQLTPRSALSKGVAACSLSTRELGIVELFEGTGEYDVDWAVHGVRRGCEVFEVVRPRRSATRPTRFSRARSKLDDDLAGDGELGR
jgi:hypothetical protein